MTVERANILRRRRATNRPLSPRTRWFHLAKSTRNRRRAFRASRPATKGRTQLMKNSFQLRFVQFSSKPRMRSLFITIYRHTPELGHEIKHGAAKEHCPVFVRTIGTNTMLRDSDAALSRSMLLTRLHDSSR